MFFLRRSLPLLLAGLILTPLAGVGVVRAAGYAKNQPAANAAGNKGSQIKPSDLPPKVVVLKFDSAERGRYFGSDVMIVRGLDVIEGRPMQVAIPNVTGEENKMNAYKPKPEPLAAATGAKPGDYLKVEADQKEQQIWVKKLTAYKAATDEEMPGVFVFQEMFSKRLEDNGQDYQIVTLVKMAQFVDAVIPMKKGTDGKMAPDDSLMKLAGSLKKGDTIEAEITPGKPYAQLVALDPHKAAQAAKLEKLGDTQIDGQKYPTVELSVDGSTQSLPLVGHVMSKKLVADGRLLAMVKQIKPGTDVLIRTRDEGGKTWLRDIQRAPKSETGGKPRFDTPKSETKADAGKAETPKPDTAKPAATAKGK